MSTNYDFEKTTHEHYEEIFKKKINLEKTLFSLMLIKWIIRTML